MKTPGSARPAVLRPLAAALLAAGLLLAAGSRAGAQAEQPEPAQSPVEKRPRVGTVRFTGNEAFSSSRLQKLLLTRPSRFWAPVRYYPEVLRQDLETLRLFYEQEGYLQARVPDVHTKEEPQRGTVDVQIDLDEGPLTRVETATVSGNQVLDEAQILGRIRLKPGDPFRSPVVREDILELMRLYAEHGYLEADIRPDIRIRPEQNLATIQLFIEEREQFRVGQVRLSGYEKTRPFVIRRELALRPGEIIRYSRILETQRRLFRTGLFQNVYVTPAPPAGGEAGRKDILVDVKESKSIEINASIGYSTIGKLGASAELKNNNIGGTALRAGIEAGIDFQKQGVGASFSEPRLFGSRIQTDLLLRLEQIAEPGYDLARVVGDLNFGWTPGQRSRASVGYQYERDAITHVQISPLPADLETDLHSLIGNYYLDTRDDLLNPTRGFFISWQGQLGQDIPLGNLPSGFRLNPYLQLTGTFRAWYPATSTTVLASALNGGWLTHLAHEEPFPLSQLFYTGGPDTVRGYAYQGVGPQDINGTPLGGTLMLVWNVMEIRQTIFRILSAALFLDAGGVWARPGDFSFNDVRWGLGAGLRLNTLVGVIRLDGALKLRPRAGESPGAVYLSVGQTF